MMSTQELATACVLDEFEHNGYDDSDFYAIVWTGTRVTVELRWTTRHAGTYFAGPAATPAQDQAARAWIAEPLAAAMLADAHQQARQPTVGAKVRSTTTRGKNLGVVGAVRRITEDRYRSTRGQTYYRALIELDDGTTRWVNADRLERIDAEPLDVAALTTQAETAAQVRGGATSSTTRTFAPADRYSSTPTSNNSKCARILGGRMTKAYHYPIVEYSGTLTDMHGLWHVKSTSERLTLHCAADLTLHYVRPEHVKPVAVPRLTPARAQALYELHRFRLKPAVTRIWNWLVAQGLAEMDDIDRPQPTALGSELAVALYWW
jgi:hypothetical protein